MESKLAISEVFYSIQGEGKTTGVPSVFVRLAGCNLMCGGMGTQFDGELHNGAEWRCDTVEVWMNGKSKNIKYILDDNHKQKIKAGAHIILTGGEPLMQSKPLGEFIDYVRNEINPEAYFEVETNGTVHPSQYLRERVNLWNCSPKLSNSGMDKSATFKPDVIKILNKENTIFKFVVNSQKEWKEITNDYIELINYDKIWLMPAGENQELLNQNKHYVVELAKENNVNFCTRLHIEIWNKKTGV